MRRVVELVLAVLLLALVAAVVRFGVPLVRADRATTLGNAYRDVLEWDSAVASYRRAIAADPGFPEPYARAGDVYRSQSALASAPEDEAERRHLARQAIAACGASEVMLRLGIFYRRIGAAERALEAFERSGQLGARDQIAVVNIQDIRRSVPVGR